MPNRDWPFIPRNGRPTVPKKIKAVKQSCKDSQVIFRYYSYLQIGGEGVFFQVVACGKQVIVRFLTSVGRRSSLQRGVAMGNEITPRPDLRIISQQMRQQIEQDLRRLSESMALGKPIHLRLGDEQETEISLPMATVNLICQALTLERDGKSFLLLEEDAEVSPEKAADILHISRPTVLKKLDGGEIPFHYVGAHRRIALADLLAYKQQRKTKTREALQQMVSLGEEMGLYDE
ncbi:MAG: helix-turn-helix domain-containing protein [Blastocatellia bacterium]